MALATAPHSSEVGEAGAEPELAATAPASAAISATGRSPAARSPDDPMAPGTQSIVAPMARVGQATCAPLTPTPGGAPSGLLYLEGERRTVFQNRRARREGRAEG